MVTMLSGCSGEYIVLDPKGPIGESQKDLIIISTLLCAVIIVPVLIWRLSLYGAIGTEPETRLPTNRIGHIVQSWRSYGGEFRSS